MVIAVGGGWAMGVEDGAMAGELVSRGLCFETAHAVAATAAMASVAPPISTHVLPRGLGTGFSLGGASEVRLERRTGAGVVGAAVADLPVGLICSLSASAKSEQRLNRFSGCLARAAAKTGSNPARSGLVSAKAGASVLRWRLMTTAGFELENKGVPASM